MGLRQNYILNVSRIHGYSKDIASNAMHLLFWDNILFRKQLLADPSPLDQIDLAFLNQIVKDPSSSSSDLDKSRSGEYFWLSHGVGRISDLEGEIKTAGSQLTSLSRIFGEFDLGSKYLDRIVNNKIQLDDLSEAS